MELGERVSDVAYYVAKKYVSLATGRPTGIEKKIVEGSIVNGQFRCDPNIQPGWEVFESIRTGRSVNVQNYSASQIRKRIVFLDEPTTSQLESKPSEFIKPKAQQPLPDEVKNKLQDVVHDIKPLSDMITRLKSKDESDCRESWTQHGLKLTAEQQYLFERYCEHVLIPELLGAPKRNKLRIAMALCYADSRNLDIKTRKRLGLNLRALNRDQVVYPALFRASKVAQPFSQSPTYQKDWAFQCGAAEGYLETTLDRLSGEVGPLNNEGVSTPLEFFGTLAGKTFDLTAGLCFRTAEFPNGTVFIKDVWYMPRDRATLSKIVAEANKSKYTQKEPKILVLNNLGGIWQPTRALFSDTLNGY